MGAVLLQDGQSLLDLLDADVKGYVLADIDNYGDGWR